jgi:hypothetical protein
MKHWGYFCRHFGWRMVVAGTLATGSVPVRADDWGNWPVPWPPPGSTNTPTSGPTPSGAGVTPPTDGSPAGTGQPPVTPPPGSSQPPAASGQPPIAADAPPDVPIPPVPITPFGSPEPASLVMGLCGVGAGLMAWRRKRTG